MNEFWTVVSAILPVFALMLAGFILRRLRWLTAEADQSLLRICVNLLLPCLIFESVLGNAALKRAENLFWPPLIAFVTVLSGIGISWVVAKLCGVAEPVSRRTFALTAGLQNYGYIPIPLCILLFDPGTLGVLLVHNVGVEIVLWTVGMAVLSGSGFRGGWRQILNPPMVALALALLLNLSGAVLESARSSVAGVSVMTGIHWLGQCAIPMALLLIGATVADHLADLAGGRTARVISSALFVRFVLMPPLFILLARWLPCSVEMKRVIVVQGAMSSAVLPIALARHYGGDTRVALQVVLGTSVAGLLAMPLWIRIGMHLARL